MSCKLRLQNKTDLFDQDKISTDLIDFDFNYFFTGKRLGDGRMIDLFVVSWIKDTDENLFIRYGVYSGYRKYWKEVITEQTKNLMMAIDVSKEVSTGQLRYFEVSKDNYLETEKFEREFLEIKSKMKRNRV